MLGEPRPNKPDPEANPRAECVHPPPAWHHHGWGAALWLHLHPAVLHPQLHLVITDILHVWLPVPGVPHPSGYLLRDHCAPLLFPPLC